MAIAFSALLKLVGDLFLWVRAMLRPRAVVVAENVLLRRQLALYVERGIKPRRADRVERFSLAMLSRYCDWRSALVVVQPRTLIAWHRAGWRLLWRYKSRAGRPRVALEVRALIRRMARENVLWGEERIANELLLKLGIRLSPRTVRKYMPKRPHGTPRGDQRWRTFLKNHAKGIIACDFVLSVTVAFRSVYVFVIIDHGTRKLIHFNVTANPTAAWTLQQLREAVGDQAQYQYLIRDRDRIYSREFDVSVKRLGLTPIRSPRDSPKANAVCERVIGTIRRECLDWMIPLSENHLREVLREWVAHYNGARPHAARGPGIPDRTPPSQKPDHREIVRLNVKPILGRLHHEYTYTCA